MKKPIEAIDKGIAGKALLKRELESALASGLSKRSPAQNHAAFRKAREAA